MRLTAIALLAAIPFPACRSEYAARSVSAFEGAYYHITDPPTACAEFVIAQDGSITPGFCAGGSVECDAARCYLICARYRGSDSAKHFLLDDSRDVSPDDFLPSQLVEIANRSDFPDALIASPVFDPREMYHSYVLEPVVWLYRSRVDCERQASWMKVDSAASKD